MWGNGAYFAINASYSDNYAHHTSDGKKIFLLCYLALGYAKEVPSHPYT